jgi:hypothetical protein
MVAHGQKRVASSERWSFNLKSKPKTKDTMKKSIHITSQGMRARVTIRKGATRTTSRLFNSMDEAVAFVLPRGNRQTRCLINGYKCVFAGWVA